MRSTAFAAGLRALVAGPARILWIAGPALVLWIGAAPNDALAASTTHAPDVPPIQALPFAGLILSLALLQAIAPELWHRHERKIVAAWALLTLVLLGLNSGWARVGATIIETALVDYLPFIILIGALYIVAGGIRIVGHLHGNPLTNLTMLLIGGVFASLVGTTGAAMVMIRPLIRANGDRLHNAHIVVFFIFIVANIGGALTPLGDPPLLIGYLNGVDFFWTTVHLSLPTVFVVALLAIVFIVIDRHCYHIDEAFVAKRTPPHDAEPLRIEGWPNVVLMLVIVAAVPALGNWKPTTQFDIDGSLIGLADLTRDILLVAVAIVSLLITPRATRTGNGFQWRPILEVATVFAGIFITLMPVVAILREGSHGAFAPILAGVTQADGAPSPAMYFWASGLLSGFLDNAPTYLAFFNLAGGDARGLMTDGARALMALSCGCVFMGALSYVGNAPNMMVRSIAVEAGIAMPGFVSYLGWSCGILLPVFGLVTLVFFR
jgi:Na+/H+ antiporter NhaD/arsenite permease-like protein